MLDLHPQALLDMDQNVTEDASRYTHLNACLMHNVTCETPALPRAFVHTSKEHSHGSLITTIKVENGGEQHTEWIYITGGPSDT